MRRQLAAALLGAALLTGGAQAVAEPPAARYVADEADVLSSETEQDIIDADTLPRALIGTPKVMPHTKRFAINLNRLTGELPDWLLYHPALDWWSPFQLVFTQEGKDAKGASAGFGNEPANLNYYYEFYEGYKKDPGAEEEDEDTTK
mgnify:CR=1 FL=1